MTHLLDTNVCIAAMRGHPAVRAQLLSRQPTDCAVSSVSLYELDSGVERCREPSAERRKVEKFVRPLHRLPFDEASAAAAARVRWSLEKRGLVIGPYDIMIAGQALALDLTLVTHNRREFGRIADLRLEDWEVA